jgi:HNH endonuclease
MKRYSPPIDPDRLREVLDYDPKTGKFTWLVNKSNRKKGRPAGHATRHGYIRIKIDRRDHYAHRLAWLHTFGDLPASDVIHRDGNKQNNAITNLTPGEPVL